MHLREIIELSFYETLETTQDVFHMRSVVQQEQQQQQQRREQQEQQQLVSPNNDPPFLPLERLTLSKTAGLTAGVAPPAVAQWMIHCSPMLRELTLVDVDLSSECALLLSTLVHSVWTVPSCRLERLSLHKTKLGLKNAVASLTYLLRHNTTLHHLSLANNSLGTKCMKALSAGLRYNATLRSLDLSMNKIGDRGIHLLAEHALDVTSDTLCRLHELDLTYNKLGPNGVATLAGALLQGHRNRTLIKLNLGLNRIGSTGALYLGSLLRYSSTLQELVLSRNNLGTELDGIREFALGLQESSGCLRKLDLSWNSLTDDHAILLADILLRGNSTLQSLNLSSNAIGNRGMIAIAQALPSDLALEELDVVGNQATDESAAVLAAVWCSFCGTGRCIPRLKSLKWDKNNFSERGRQRLENASRFRDNMQLWLGEYLNETFVRAREPGDSMFHSNHHHPHNHHNNYNNHHYHRPCQRQRAVNMDFTGRDMGDDELIAVVNHLAQANSDQSNQQRRYRHSNAAHEATDATDDDDDDEGCPNGLVPLEPMRVTTLWLKDDYRLTSRGVISLCQDVLATNSKAAARIERLYLEGAPLVSDRGAAAIAQALLTNSSLRVLSLTACGITEDGAKRLANGLRRNKTLVRLNLTGNQIGDVGVLQLLRAILEHKSSFDNDDEDEDDDFDEVYQSSNSNTTSTNMNKGNYIPQPHPSLRALNVSRNGLTDQGLALCPAMVGLEELNLSHNEITDLGALDLAKACCRCGGGGGGASSGCSTPQQSNLRWLLLSHNRLTSKGIQALELFLPIPHVLDADHQYDVTTINGER